MNDNFCVSHKRPWSLFSLTICRHYFISGEQAVNHYPKQWFTSSLMHICVTNLICQIFEINLFYVMTFTQGLVYTDTIYLSLRGCWTAVVYADKKYPWEAFVTTPMYPHNNTQRWPPFKQSVYVLVLPTCLRYEIWWVPSSCRVILAGAHLRRRAKYNEFRFSLGIFRGAFGWFLQLPFQQIIYVV